MRLEQENPSLLVQLMPHGAKISKDMIRNGADYAFIELVFETEDKAVLQAMNELDIPMDDNQIIISRKSCREEVYPRLMGRMLLHNCFINHC